MLADEPPTDFPIWVLLVAMLVFAGLGYGLLMDGRKWAKRHQEGDIPEPQGTWANLWAANYTTPQHPEDGIFFGWLFLGLSVVALGAVVVTKLLGLW